MLEFVEKRRSWFVFLMVSVIVGTISTAASAWEKTGQGQITWLEAGWNEPQMLLRLDAPITNPGNCPTPDFYITDQSNSGTPLFNAALMSAHMANRRVTLVIDGCHANRPKIIAVQVH